VDHHIEIEDAFLGLSSASVALQIGAADITFLWTEVLVVTILSVQTPVRERRNAVLASQDPPLRLISESALSLLPGGAKLAVGALRSADRRRQFLNGTLALYYLLHSRCLAKSSQRRKNAFLDMIGPDFPVPSGTPRFRLTSSNRERRGNC
jgi:hypothetical protein